MKEYETGSNRFNQSAFRQLCGLISLIASFIFGFWALIFIGGAMLTADVYDLCLSPLLFVICYCWRKLHEIYFPAPAMPADGE